MAIDPRILFMQRPFQMPNRNAIEGEALSLAQLTDQRMLQRMQLEQRQREAQERAAFEQVLPDLVAGNFAPEAVQRAVRAAPAAGPGVLKYVEAQRKAQAEQEKTQAETLHKTTEAKLKIADRFANEAQWLSEHPLLDDPNVGPQMVSRFQQKIADAGLEKILTTVPFQDWNNPAAARRGLASAGSMFYDIKDRIAQTETGRAHRATEAGQEAQRKETERFHTGTLGHQAATLAETRAEHGRIAGRAREQNVAPQIVTDAEGNITVVDRRTATGRPVLGPTGEPLKKATAADKPLTETQGNATAFGLRMRHASKTIDELETSGLNPASPEVAMSGGQGIIGTPLHAAASGPAQKYDQAKRNWITANARKESGAAIPPPEMAAEMRKWFPIVGDKKEVVETKAAARKVAEQAMTIQAGPGARHIPAPTSAGEDKDILDKADLILGVRKGK